MRRSAKSDQHSVAMARFSRVALAAALAAAIAATLGACAKQDATPDRAMRMDSAGLTSSKVAADTLMSNDSSATAKGMRAMNDANILYMLDQSNVTDSTEGVIAAKHGTTQDVKDFGRMMMRDHHSLRQDGQKLAAKAGVVPVAPTDDKNKEAAAASIARLASMPKGADWDKAYINDEVSGHQNVLAYLHAATKSTRNQALKDLLIKATSKVQQHLDKALELQEKMATM